MPGGGNDAGTAELALAQQLTTPTRLGPSGALLGPRREAEELASPSPRGQTVYRGDHPESGRSQTDLREFPAGLFRNQPT